MNREEYFREIERLHKERGYGYTFQNAAPEPTVWSTWSTRLPERDIFPFIFKPFQLFQYKLQYPETTLYVDDPIQYGDRRRQVYRETIKSLKKRKLDPTNLLDVGVLSQPRDMLEKHLQRCAERMLPIHDNLTSVLKVWVAETERSILKYHTDFGNRYFFEYSPDQVRKMRQLIVQGNGLWRSLLLSTDTEILTNDIESTLSSFETPEFIKATTRAGLLYYHGLLLPLKEEALDVELRLLAMEVIIAAAVIGNPIPQWKPSGLQRTHGNSKYLPYKHEIVELWNECKRDSEYPSEQKTYDYVFVFKFQDKLASKIENELRQKVDPPSLSTIRAYVQDE